MDTLVVAPGFVLRALGSTAGVSWVAWDGQADRPAEVADAEVWVAPYAVGTGPESIREAFAAMPRLRLVQLLSAGAEPWPSVLPDEVTLCAGRGVHGGSTAELAVTLLLAVVRELPRYVAQQAQRRWERHEPDTLIGKHVVIVGAGDIGQRVAATLRSMEVRVTLAGRTARAGVIAFDDLRPAEVDVLVLALPHTAQTAGLIGSGTLAGLPDGAIVVNVGRGSAVDLAALTDEVVRGRLRAALDVTDPEPLPADHPLWGSPGALLTPHVGGGATGWEGRAIDLVADQLARWRSGRELRAVVEGGY